jgi:hypothetical protein
MLFFRMALVIILTRKDLHQEILCQLHKFNKMLGASFEGWILKRYGLYDVVSNAYKYVHCDLIDTTRYTTRNFVFCNLSYATKKSHMQLFWSCMRHFLVA